MTRLEIMNDNKKEYAKLEKKILGMTGLEKAVAQHITLKWIKGNKWMGGISDSVANRAYDKLMAMGYEFKEIMKEESRQMEEITNSMLGERSPYNRKFDF